MPTHKKVKKAKSGLKKPSAGKKHAGLRALPRSVRNKMGYAKKGTEKKKAQYGAKASMAAGGKKYGSAKKGHKVKKAKSGSIKSMIKRADSFGKKKSGKYLRQDAKKGKRLNIKKAIKKPGALTAAAKRKGMTIAQYCKNPPGRKATQRCNFAKTLKKITNKNKKKKK